MEMAFLPMSAIWLFLKKNQNFISKKTLAITTFLQLMTGKK
jgi:hypothetical protein